jgi:eukaryotic-like serine/threonine-protein kinase
MKKLRPTARLDERPFWEEDEGPRGPTAEVQTSSPIPSVVDGYRIGAILGQGATATVFAATDREGRPWALKAILADDTSAANVGREAKLLAKVRHASIPRVDRVGTLPSGRPYLVMERVEGRPLSDVLAEDGPLPWLEVKALLVDLLDALAALHGEGLIHRDVKPANVLIRATAPRLSLVDFGITRQVKGGLVPPTTAHVVRGTLEYMSPEQLAGEPIDASSDVFSAGVLAFEAATGEVPWGTGGGGVQGRRKAITRAPSLLRPRQIPARDFATLTRLLAVDRVSRFPSAHVARAQLALTR